MAYARLTTRNTSGLHPNLRGMGAYAAMSTDSTAGLSPNFRGLDYRGLGIAMPLTNFTIGPGGQFAISTASTPTSTSLWDQILTWMSGSTFLPGTPNSVVAIAGGVALLAWIGRGRRR